MDLPIIRPARTSDLHEIIRMIYALSDFHGAQATVTLEALQDAFFTSHHATAFVAQTPGGLIGYAGVVYAITLHTGQCRMDIHHLFIDDGHRNRGIGRSLIAAATDLATQRGAMGLTIATDPKNLTAQAAYHRMGLEQITDAGPRFWIPVDNA